MKKIPGLQDQIEVAVATWLLVSPWLLGYGEPFTAGPVSASVVGLVVLLVSIDDLFFPNLIEEWMDATFGAALIVSPWVGGYSDNAVATVNAVASGLLITGVAFWALRQLSELRVAPGHQTPFRT